MGVCTRGYSGVYCGAGKCCELWRPEDPWWRQHLAHLTIYIACFSQAGLDGPDVKLSLIVLEHAHLLKSASDRPPLL